MSEHPNFDAMSFDELKEYADNNGITYAYNLGEARLRNKIKATSNTPLERLNAAEPKEVKKITLKPATKKEILAERAKEAKKLVRVRITPMDPNKKDWPGELVSVGSSQLGTIKRYIPYNSPDGWHIENILLNELKNRKCTVFIPAGNKQDKTLKRSKRIPAYSIDLLPPLTPDQLQELAQRQAMSGSIEIEE